MVRLTGLIAVAVAACALTACSNHAGTLPNYESKAPAGGTPSGATTNALGSASGIGVEEQTPAAAEQQALLKKLVVYFDFDSSQIQQDFDPILAAHAKFLAAHPNARVRLEGNTDERGSREYNIGLGERRAQAVKQYLLLQGASEGQLSTVSYGEERPAVNGHDEAAYRLNRRVEIVYVK